jgi:transcriptional regulator with XRE-family HTH domain
MRARPGLLEARIDETVRPIPCENCAGFDAILAARSMSSKCDTVGVCGGCGRKNAIYSKGLCETCHHEKIEELAIKDAREAARDLAGERFTQAIRLVLGDAVPELSSTDIGAYVRAIREAADLRRPEFGEAIGKSHGTIAKIECGNLRPSAALLERIAERFGSIAKKVFLEGYQEPQAPARARTIPVREPRNKAQNAELLLGWKAIACFAGLSERTLRSRGRELSEGGYVNYVAIGFGPKRACAWTTDMVEWLEKENGGRRKRVYALREETVREPINSSGGTELKVGWKEISRFVGFSERKSRGLSDELFEGGWVFYVEVNIGPPRVCGWTSDLRDWMRRREAQKTGYRTAARSIQWFAESPGGFEDGRLSHHEPMVSKSHAKWQVPLIQASKMEANHVE